MLPSTVTTAPHHHTTSRLSSSSTFFHRKPFSFFFFIKSPSRFRRTLRTSATLLHGRRPRRNALRQKLLSKDEPRLLQSPSEPIPIEIPEIHTNSNTRKTKLDSWIEQYNADNALWGIGTGPIFLVSRDSDGAVVDVSIDAEEIVRRNVLGGEEIDVREKIDRAREIATAISSGSQAVPENSSIVRFVEEKRAEVADLSPTDRVRDLGLTLRFAKMPWNVALCGLFVPLAAWWLWNAMSTKGDLTSLEREMLERKMRARRRSGVVVEGNVEVLPAAADGGGVVSDGVKIKRPELDRERLRSDISIAKTRGDVVSPKSSGFDVKVEEIREMAKKARELEMEEVCGRSEDVRDDVRLESSDLQNLPTPGSSVEDVEESAAKVAEDFAGNGDAVNGNERARFMEEGRDSVVRGLPLSTDKSAAVTKPKIIRSVEEAREYLARKNKATEERLLSSLAGGNVEESESIKRVNGAVFEEGFGLMGNLEFGKMDSEFNGKRSKKASLGTVHLNSYGEGSESGNPSGESHRDVTDTECAEFSIRNHVAENDESQNIEENISLESSFSQDFHDELPAGGKLDEVIELEHNLPSAIDSEGIPEKSPKMSDPKLEDGDGTLLENTHDSASVEETGHLPPDKSHWIEEYFHEFEPISKKVREGFRENFAMAKKKERDMTNVGLHELDLEDDEMEWLKDEQVKDVFFKVRDNELAGKDPFHSISAEDKQAFFRGLEKKAEKFNKKLSALHEWLHSRIENVDYGADGISIYDPPEKVFPRWKGPAFDKYPAFLKNSERKQQASDAIKEEGIFSRGKDREEVGNSSGSALPVISVDVNSKRQQNRAKSAARTIIDSSDGSSRAGKKGGKEQWEHTKKWSRGFLEIYNAETDPEVKSAMKDMGKDLDRWITEKEVEDVGKLMSELPEKQRQYIEKKVDKVKREMERYGPQAVVSKYREYSEEKEEDYLWWLDLKFVLCIELYTVENGSQKVGFYSLEMAPDLELDPKQHHVIAFEDPRDSKNFCYVIQTHLEMLQLGRAFVVPRPPKDAFREAEANGFHVTVVRKGELKLNIDRALEEIEEEIVEIGSKIYQDKIMRERSVDVGALLTGIIASERSEK